MQSAHVHGAAKRKSARPSPPLDRFSHTPPRTAFVLCLAFSPSTTITFFHPYFSPRTHTRRESAIPLGFISEAGAGTTLRGSTYSSTLHATWTLRIATRHTRLLANIASTSRHHQGERSTMVSFFGVLTVSPCLELQHFFISTRSLACAIPSLSMRPIPLAVEFQSRFTNTS